MGLCAWHSKHSTLVKRRQCGASLNVARNEDASSWSRHEVSKIAHCFAVEHNQDPIRRRLAAIHEAPAMRAQAIHVDGSGAVTIGSPLGVKSSESKARPVGV
jgi:hypothetical protein